MSKKKILIFVILILAICIASLFLVNFNSSKQTKIVDKIYGSKSKDAIILAMILPLQGEFADLGQSALKGAQLATEVINKQGGILGHKIELVVGDSRSSAELAAEITREFNNKGYKIIIGGLNKEETLSIIDNSKSQLIFYLSDATPLTCTREDALKVNPRIWGMGITPQMQIETFLISLSDKFRQPERAFDMYLYGNVGQENIADQIKEVSQGLEFKVVGEDYVDLRINDLFQRVRKIFDFKPDLLMFFTEDLGTEKFIFHAHKLSLRTEMTVATINSIKQEKADKYGELSNGIWTTTTYSDEIKNDTNISFLKNWHEHFKDNSRPTSTSIKSYSTIMIIQEAMIKSGEAKIESLDKGLQDLELELPQGRISVASENHLLVQPLYLTQIDNGKFTKLELIGDVSHPALESCSYPQADEAKHKALKIPEDY